MKCASALSTSPGSDEALADVLARVADGLEGERADLAVVFASEHHAGTLGHLAAELVGTGLAGRVIGCTGESILGEDREIEGEAALSLWAIRLPEGSTVRTLRLQYEGDDIVGWEPPPTSEGLLILLGDPFSFPTEAWLKRVGADAPGLRVVGGMASAARRPGGNRLAIDGELVGSGAVAAWIEGPVGVRTVVSQGCRPIGRPMIVTRSEKTLVQELGRRPALEVLREQFEALDPEDQSLVQPGLHLGRVINEYQDSFGRGDFLVRNVVGVDDSGAISVTDAIRVGQTVQFHVRDAATADEDLRALAPPPRPGTTPAGALLFSCNGRGTRLFDAPNHDIAALHAALGPIPVAGFFAMGEIGPVGGQNFLHGFTASIAVFEDESR